MLYDFQIRRYVGGSELKKNTAKTRVSTVVCFRSNQEGHTRSSKSMLRLYKTNPKYHLTPET